VKNYRIIELKWLLNFYRLTSNTALLTSYIPIAVELKKKIVGVNLTISLNNFFVLLAPALLLSSLQLIASVLLFESVPSLTGSHTVQYS
jgi:hypothetical protein